MSMNTLFFVMPVLVPMSLVVVMLVVMLVSFIRRLSVVLRAHVDIEFDSLDSPANQVPGVEMVSFERQLLQLGLEFGEVQAQIQHGAEEHVPAHSTKDIEIKSFHKIPEAWQREE